MGKTFKNTSEYINKEEKRNRKSLKPKNKLKYKDFHKED